MSREIFKRPQAERDIEEAFVFIAGRDTDSGLDFLHAVEQTLDVIAENPFIGVERKFDAPGLESVRMWRVQSYERHLIFYIVESAAIEVIRVIHSSLDYTRTFGEKE